MFTTSTEKIPVQWVSLNALVLSSSKYGEAYDRIKITHEIGLSSPLQQDESFYIPPSGKPIDVRTSFPDGNIINFAGQRAKDLDDELSQYGSAIKAQNVAEAERLHQLLLHTSMLTPVPFKAGKTVMTFDYELALYPGDNGVFELCLWAPMPSFQIQPGGQITATIQLPSSNSQAFKAQLVEPPKGYQADSQGNLGSEIAPVLDQEYLLRRIIVWTWQNDPYFKVKYQYIG